MLNIAEGLKTIYKNDILPIVSQNIYKTLTIHFPSIALTITNDRIVDDSFELSESICSEGALVFGGCESSSVKFTVVDISENLKGLEFTITQTIAGYDPVLLGTFKVESAEKQDDLRFKDIVAYDSMQMFDIDVATWYNTLDFTNLTLNQFRASLCAYVGITEEDVTLPNDNMTVEKTIDATQISGRDVLKCIEELNGCFGHINRNGVLCHIVLQPSYGLYPSVTLYPSDTLYPVSESDASYTQDDLIDETLSKAMYQTVRFEEYTVKEIDKLQIRQEEDDIGAIVTREHERIVDTLSGINITSNKAEDSTVSITKIEGASTQVVTVQGKNLLPKFIGQIVSGITATVSSDGTIILNGVASTTVFLKTVISVSLNGIYTFSSNNPIGNSGVTLRLYDGTNTDMTLGIPSQKAIFSFNNIIFTSLEIRIASGTILNNFIIKPQLELGSTATAYEPFVPNSPSPEYPSPIISAENFDITASNGVDENSVNIPYVLRSLPSGTKDTFEVIDGVLTHVKRVNEVVFDGSADEGWGVNLALNSKTRYTIKIPGIKPSASNDIKANALCSHFLALNNNQTYALNTGMSVGVYITNNTVYFYHPLYSNETTANTFKTWLQSNPITVQYELATPIYTPIADLRLTSYKGLTNVFTNANPLVNFTAEFYGDLNNTYVIEGNFLVFGKSAEELDTIAKNTFGNMSKRPYRPYQSENIGLPYIEVGDTIEFNTNDVVSGYVLNRTLTGIQSLKDKFSAEGSEEREQNFGLNKEIIQLQGRTAILKKTVDEVSVNLSNLAENTESQFTQTAESIELKVSKDDVISSINQSAEEITISASKINFSGYATFDVDGEITGISGNLVKTGSIESTNYVVNVSGTKINLDTGEFLSKNFKIDTDGNAEFNGAVKGASIFGGNFLSSNWDEISLGQTYDEIEIEGGILTARRTLYTSDGATYDSQTTIQYNELNTYKVIASGYVASPRGEFETLLMGNVNGAEVVFDDEFSIRWYLRPTNGGSYSYYLGNSSYPWTGLYVRNITHSSGGTIGFFGASPKSKTSITDLSTSATQPDIINKINAILDVFQGYGLL